VCLALLTLYRRTPSIGRWDMLPPAGGATPHEPDADASGDPAPAALGAEQPTLGHPEPPQEE
jgi:hypothetical protein